MNLDIQTEHVAMRPEWHRVIDEWIETCAKRHAGLIGIELTLRHAEHHRPGEEVEAVATAPGPSLRVARQAEAMDVALRDALDTLAQELAAHEATDRRGHGGSPTRAAPSCPHA